MMLEETDYVSSIVEDEPSLNAEGEREQLEKVYDNATTGPTAYSPRYDLSPVDRTPVRYPA